MKLKLKLKLLIAIILMILINSNVYASENMDFYKNKLCETSGGIANYKLSNGINIDCLTAQYAVEFSSAKQWDTCLGKALYKAAITNRQPACALLMNGKSDYQIYGMRLLKTLETYYLNDFKTFYINIDK